MQSLFTKLYTCIFTFVACPRCYYEANSLGKKNRGMQTDMVLYYNNQRSCGSGNSLTEEEHENLYESL